MAMIGALLLLQPDLGAFGVIVAIAMGILFLGGVNGGCSPASRSCWPAPSRW
jgi:cell division protein FtsW (lipid II flippase)